MTVILIKLLYKNTINNVLNFGMRVTDGLPVKPVVRVEGLEPPRLAAPEPKSGASANFATPAFPMALSIIDLLGFTKRFLV